MSDLRISKGIIMKLASLENYETSWGKHTARPGVAGRLRSSEIRRDGRFCWENLVFTRENLAFTWKNDGLYQTKA